MNLFPTNREFVWLVLKRRNDLNSNIMKEFMIGEMLIYISTLMSMLNKLLVDLDKTDLRLDFGDTVIHCQYITCTLVQKEVLKTGE